MDLVEQNLKGSEIKSQAPPNRTLSTFRIAQVIRQIGENVDADFGDHHLFTGTNHGPITRKLSTSGLIINLPAPDNAHEVSEENINHIGGCTKFP
ncbi:MAG TPA: hypothetical protein VGO47_05515 [Chlamydiales bacterium]|nr:hypothetical protein [Chlamydiales bacterium]